MQHMYLQLFNKSMGCCCLPGLSTFGSFPCRLTLTCVTITVLNTVKEGNKVHLLKFCTSVKFWGSCTLLEYFRLKWLYSFTPLHLRLILHFSLSWLDSLFEAQRVKSIQYFTKTQRLEKVKKINKIVCSRVLFFTLSYLPLIISWPLVIHIVVAWRASQHLGWEPQDYTTWLYLK